MAKRGSSWWKYAAAWAAGVIYFTSQDFAYLPAQRPHWLHLLGLNAMQVTVWTLLIIPAFAFLRRWPLEGPGAWKRWVAFVLTTLLLVSLGLWAAFLVERADSHRALFGGPGYSALLARFFTLYFHFYFLTFVSVLLAYHAYTWRHQFMDQALRASQLETQLFHAQNQALRMQLQPHFMFNTLHSIGTLMHSDVDAADGMISRLGDLLRMSLDRSRDQEITLGEELAFLGAYLDIERIRFKDRLTVVIDVPERLRQARIPTLILQPLVENALKHGFSRQRREGTVAIRAHQRGDALCLEVEDDGQGPPSFHREGVGLRSVRERLHLTYGELAAFSFGRMSDQRTLAALSLPLSPVPLPDGAAP